MGFIVVEISDMKIAKAPDLLITYALGSCVGICLQDPVAGVAGMAHIMQPDSSVSPNDRNRYKFADTAIPDMLLKLEAKGAMRPRLQAKIAGGAQMFEIQISSSSKLNSAWQIGQRNVEAVVETLGRLKIPITAQDVLKNYGRTITFDPRSGIMTVKALNKTMVQI